MLSICIFNKNESEFKLEKAYANFECAKTSIKFYKYILGVHKRSTNLAVYDELGRTPYFIDIICAIIKYFNRRKAMDDDSLLAQTLEASKEMHESGKQCWYTGFLFILNDLNINCNESIGKI